MSNLIRKQDAIDEWKNDFKEYINALNIPKDDYKGIMEYIDELPSVQLEQPQWIPVTEALPNDDNDYLVMDDEGNRAVGYYRRDAKAWDSYCFGWLENRDEPPYGIETVIAWMPLPKAYKIK